MIDWLKAHWFLFAALVAMGVAWGEQRMRVETVEDAVKQQTIIQQQVQDNARRTERVDERTERMLEQQERQEQLLRLILEKVK